MGCPAPVRLDNKTPHNGRMSPRNLLLASFRAALAAADPLKIVPQHLPTPPKGRTLVPPLPESAVGFPKIPGLTYTGRHNELYLKDIDAQPPRDIYGKQYVMLVPKVDADGNDVAGVRSVTVQVPLGTYTGWNQRKAGFMENEFCDLQGSYFPFARTAAERGGDPRPSLQERYENHAGYVAKVEATAQKLVSEGFLLPEDAVRLIAEAQPLELGFLTAISAADSARRAVAGKLSGGGTQRE